MRIALLLLATLLGQQTAQPGGQPLRYVGACTPTIGDGGWVNATFTYIGGTPPAVTLDTEWRQPLVCQPIDDANCNWCMELILYVRNVDGQWVRAFTGDPYIYDAVYGADCGTSFVADWNVLWSGTLHPPANLWLRAQIFAGPCGNRGALLGHTDIYYTI
jgi:hypothetical protein